MRPSCGVLLWHSGVKKGPDLLHLLISMVQLLPHGQFQATFVIPLMAQLGRNANDWPSWASTSRLPHTADSAPGQKLRRRVFWKAAHPTPFLSWAGTNHREPKPSRGEKPKENWGRLLWEPWMQLLEPMQLEPQMQLPVSTVPSGHRELGAGSLWGTPGVAFSREACVLPARGVRGWLWVLCTSLLNLPVCLKSSRILKHQLCPPEKIAMRSAETMCGKPCCRLERDLYVEYAFIKLINIYVYMDMVPRS